MTDWSTSNRQLVRNSTCTKTRLSPFQAKRPVTFRQTTCHFLKTTRHFSKNNPSLLRNNPSLFDKRPVTFRQTTRRLRKDKCKAFYFDREMNLIGCKSFFSTKRHTPTPSSRARVRTHYRDFALFAVTSVTE